MAEELKTPPEANTPKPATSADRYADFISTQDDYHSIFQSTDSGATIDELGISTGKISKKD